MTCRARPYCTIATGNPGSSACQHLAPFHGQEAQELPIAQISRSPTPLTPGRLDLQLRASRRAPGPPLPRHGSNCSGAVTQPALTAGSPAFAARLVGASQSRSSSGDGRRSSRRDGGRRRALRTPQTRAVRARRAASPRVERPRPRLRASILAPPARPLTVDHTQFRRKTQPNALGIED